MSAGERTANTVGGAASDGLRWGLKGILIGGLLGMAVLAGIPLMIGIAAGLFSTAIGATIGTVAGIVLATIGGYIGAAKAGFLGASLGVIKGAGSGLMKPSANSKLETQLAVEEQRSMELQGQLMERQRAASSFDNPDATADHVNKTQLATPPVPGQAI